MRASASSYTVEPLIIDDLHCGKLRLVLEQYAPLVPGLLLYFPSRAQASPVLRAFLEVVRELTERNTLARQSRRPR